MPRRQKRYMTAPTINIVPYVDVLLVLLVIFIAAAPMMIHGVEVDLPHASAKAMRSNSAQLTVNIQPSGGYTTVAVNNGKSGDRHQFPSTNALVKYLKPWSKHEPDGQILIAAAPQVRYDAFAKVMSKLYQADITHVGLLTDPQK